MIIKREIVNRIYDQGETEMPVEACGYLAGKAEHVTKYFPMQNMDNSSEHFALDPKEQFNVIRQVRSEKLDLLAVYHTHPKTPARPSAEDIRLAYDPDIIYVIASLIDGTRDIRAFRIIAGKVSEEKLIIEE